MSFGEGNLRTAVAELQVENERLRELLRDLLARVRTAEQLCGMAFVDARFEERLREMGIEDER